MAIVIVVLVAVLFIVVFLSLWIHRCSNDRRACVGAALLTRRARMLAEASRGLEAQVLETFPTFSYSTVKALKIGKGALECVVCLNQIDDVQTVRLIPKCDHVLHVECIDAWLKNHVTCPVCRCDLVPKPGESTQTASELQNDATSSRDGVSNVEVYGEDEERSTVIRISEFEDACR